MTEHKFLEAMAAALASTIAQNRARRHRIGPGRRTLYADWKEVQKHRRQMTVNPHTRKVGYQFPEYVKWRAAFDAKQELNQ